ncbi:hypothetical protein [Paraburkholderia sp. J41]|uniref:hypothetical protein n=1 Tax=Paraburkholderia sp. J41 TaxID=2805433 RepID=UPI002AC31488|nr:hypothetical protein [Paraburkholderia sp. J41]
MFRTIEEQRRVIGKARQATVRARRRSRKNDAPLNELLDRILPFTLATTEEAETVDYAVPVQAFNVEEW